MKSEGHAAFSPHLLRVLSDPPSPLPRVMLWLLLALLAILLVAGLVGRLDVVSRAHGALIPKTHLKIVQPAEGGRVSEIRVAEGQLVSAGDVLMVMDPTLLNSDASKIASQLDMERLQLRRIDAELGGGAFERTAADDEGLFSKIYEQYQANISSLEHTVSAHRAMIDQSHGDLAAAKERRQKLKELLRIYTEQEQAYLRLGDQGYTNRLDMLEAQGRRIETERDLGAQQHEITSLQARIAESQAQLASVHAGYRKQLFDERVAVKTRLAQLEEDWKQQRYRSELLELRAPQDGYVHEIATHTQGTVVPAGTVMMKIVPTNEPLIAEVHLESKDIGYVQESQQARIKIETYEFQRYGTIPAVIASVGRDATANEDVGRNPANGEGTGRTFRVLLDLDSQHLEHDGKAFPLLAGMSVSAEIKLGTRSVLEYLLSPVAKGFLEAAHER